MSHTSNTAKAAILDLDEALERKAQEFLAKRVSEAETRLFDASDDLDFATNDDNLFSVRYSPNHDRNVVVFENPERSRIIEVPVG